MNGFLVLSVLWMGLLLGGWLLVGRSLGRSLPKGSGPRPGTWAERSEEERPGEGHTETSRRDRDPAAVPVRPAAPMPAPLS